MMNIRFQWPLYNAINRIVGSKIKTLISYTCTIISKVMAHLHQHGDGHRANGARDGGDV